MYGLTSAAAIVEIKNAAESNNALRQTLNFGLIVPPYLADQ
jgi:hypothetical protein